MYVSRVFSLGICVCQLITLCVALICHRTEGITAPLHTLFSTYRRVFFELLFADWPPLNESTCMMRTKRACHYINVILYFITFSRIKAIAVMKLTCVMVSTDYNFMSNASELYKNVPTPDDSFPLAKRLLSVEPLSSNEFCWHILLNSWFTAESWHKVTFLHGCVQVASSSLEPLNRWAF